MVTNVIPHDPDAFTQGLEARNGYLWETTGLYGGSTFRKTSLETGEVLDIFHFPDSVFAEGFTFLNDTTVCVLTWREGTAFLMDPRSMEITGEFSFSGEGWGLCLAEDTLYQSNGTSTLILRSPETFEPTGELEVTLNGEPQPFLNELEYAGGFILANQWRTSRILFIERGTGTVRRVVNLRGSVPSTGVMNGIALRDDGALLCTGKNWHITLILEGTDIR